MMGSNMMLVTAPASWVVMDRVVLPVDCISRSNTMDKSRPKLNTVTMVRYWPPRACRC